VEKNEMKTVTQILAGTKLKAIALAASLALAAAMAGCARPDGVPPFSQMVAEAPAQTASFQAPDDGTVYVAGPGRWGQPRHLAYSGLIRRGEVVTVDPTQGHLLVNGKVQEATIETGKSYYQVWYAPIRTGLLLGD
jgi:hypothetical protein